MIATVLRRGVVGIVVQVLAASGVGALGVQTLWPAAEAPPAPAVAPGPGQDGYILLAMDQALLAVRQYVEAGSRETQRALERDFDGNLRQLEGHLAGLEGGSADQRQVAGVLRTDTLRFEIIARELLAAPPAGPGAGDARLTELRRIRETTVATVGQLYQPAQAQAAALPASTGTLIGGGFAALGACLAGCVALARYAVA